MKYNYILSLGSNIEPRKDYLLKASKKLNLIGNIIRKSSIYETEPWGHKNQANFYNAILKFESSLAPDQLLHSLKSIERSIGRTNSYQWGPREIDIDIIFCRNFTCNEPDLKIPHPEFAARRFVLEPLIEVDNDYISPGSNKSVEDFLTSCKDKSDIHKLDLNW